MTRVPVWFVVALTLLISSCHQATSPPPQNSPIVPAPIFVSTDAGQTWTRRTVSGMTSIQDIESITQSEIYATGSNGTDARLMRTTDGGTIWGQIHLLTGAAFGDLEVSNGRIFVTGPSVDYSLNNGSTWSQATTLPTGGGIKYTDLEISQTNPNTLFLCGTPGVFKSTDQGATWATILPGSYRSVDEPVPGRIVVAGTDISVTMDEGANWTHFSTGGAQMNSVLFNGVGFGNGIAVGTGGSMFRSTDAGISWNAVASGSNADLVDVTYFSSTTFFIFRWYAITSTKVLQSTDEGATWPAALQQALPLSGSETANQISDLNDQEIWIAGKN